MIWPPEIWKPADSAVAFDGDEVVPLIRQYSYILDAVSRVRVQFVASSYYLALLLRLEIDCR
jgi:hypothetical protein